MNDSWHSKVAHGQRFEFWANWASFLRLLDGERTRLAGGSPEGLLHGHYPLARCRANAYLHSIYFCHNVTDWINGHLLESASPDVVFRFLASRKLALPAAHMAGSKFGFNKFTFGRGEQVYSCAA